MRATINIGDIVIEVEGTLTEVLCGLEHFNGDSKKGELREELIKRLNFNMAHNRVFNFLGNEVRIIGTGRTSGDAEIFEYYFSDGSELKLTC